MDMGNDESGNEKQKGHFLPIPAGMGKVADAVEKGFEKGFETLTGHAATKKSVDDDGNNGALVAFTGSTKQEPENDSLMTSSTSPTTKRSSSDPGAHGQTEIDDDDESADNGIVLHTKSDYKFGAVYWRHGFSLPENGRMKIKGNNIIFKGIIGTKLSFSLEDIDIGKVSRMGGLVHDAFVVHVVKSSNVGDVDTAEGEKFLFSTVLKDRTKVVNKIQQAQANVKLTREEKQFDDNATRGGGPRAKKKSKFRLPPDPTMQKMKIIADRKLKGVSLQDYYEVAWSEGQNGKKPMYGPFLEKAGKNNVVVSSWQPGQYEGEWCGEAYTEERIVTFEFMKQTIGQTLVNVKHTQRCRRKDNDQCIVQIKMEMKGFPYAECFVVEVRHVASRVGDSDLSIQIGMHVKFLKSCMFESKIRTNTGAETTKAQLTLLEMILGECAPFAKVEGSADETEDEDDGAEALENALAAGAPKSMAYTPLILPDSVIKVLRYIMMTIVTLFRNYLEPYIQPELFDPFPPSSVKEALQSARARVKFLEEVSLKSSSERRKKDISREIALIGKSFDRIEKMSVNSNCPAD